MEIERKFLVKDLPIDLDQYEKRELEQGYISTSPVIRIRRSDDSYILTIKGKGLIEREEHELFIEQEQYEQLLTKLDYPLIKKTRYLIPFNHLTIELDCFHNFLDGLVLAEVEFDSYEESLEFIPPSWFGKDVSESNRYHNNHLCQIKSLDEIL